MKFTRYTRGAIVAYPFDASGTIGLRRPEGLNLLRTSDDIPRSVIERTDVADVVTIFGCAREAWELRGVEVVP